MYSLTNSASLEPLLDKISDQKVVMAGEASHGTHEFYTWRTAISKRLIEEKGMPGFFWIAIATTHRFKYYSNTIQLFQPINKPVFYG